MSFGYGQQTPYDSTSEFNVLSFIIKQMIAKMNTMKLVQVVAVHSNGAVAAAGTVDVMPLVNQIDGNGNSTPHGVVYGIPWWRLQGGLNAVICDPVVNDIGYVTVSDRDISSVISTKAQANPGSSRKFDLADGIYVGGCLNAVPTQYIQFTSTGIVIADGNGNQIQFGASGITLIGNVIMQNNLQLAGQIEAANGGTYSGSIHTSGTITGDADVVGGGKSLKTHIHSGVTAGGGVSGPPV